MIIVKADADEVKHRFGIMKNQEDVKAAMEAANWD